MPDPEVNIKFNAEANDVPPVVDKLRQLFDDLAANLQRGTGAYEDMRARVQQTADAVQNLLRTAGETGNPEAVRAVEQAFSAGASTVAKYGENMEAIRAKMEQLRAAASTVQAAVTSGNMSYEDAAARLSKYAEASARGASSLERIGKAQQIAGKELDQARALESSLTKWAEMQRVMSSARAEIEAQQQAVQGFLAQLGQLDAALSKNTAGYTAQAAEIAQAREALVAYGQELRRVGEQLSARQPGLGAALTPTGSARPASDPQAAAALERERAAMEKILNQLRDIDTTVRTSTAQRTIAHEKAAAAAQREAAAYEQASTRATAAAQREAAAQEQTAYAMQLATMKKHELAAETKRLIAERKKASAAGDTEAYKRLTAQLSQCRTAMRSVTQEAQMNKIAMMQQAQTAAMMGSQIQNIGSQISGMSEAAENGTLNVTGLASGIMSLSMALKAGMGPLGWAMLAIQGLQSAWNFFADRAKKAREAQEKLNKTIAETHDLMRSGVQKELANELKLYKENADARLTLIQEEADKRDQLTRSASERDAERRQIALENLRREVENNIEQARLDATSGKMTQDALDAYIKQEEDRFAAAQENEIKIAGMRRDIANKNERDTQLGIYNQIKENYGKLFARFTAASKTPLEKLDSSISEENAAGVREILRELDTLTETEQQKAKEQDALSQTLEDIKNTRDNSRESERIATVVAMNDVWKERLAAQNGMLEAENKLAEQYPILLELAKGVKDVEKMNYNQKLRAGAQIYLQLAELKKTTDAAKNAATEADKQLKISGDKTKADIDALRASQKLKDNQRKADEKTRKNAEALEEVQRTGSLEEQRDLLLAQRSEMVEGSEQWKRYTDQIRRLNDRIREDLINEFARTHAPEEVRAELERLRDRCKEGSDAWKRYTDQIRRLEVQGIREGLEKYKRELEISSTYQKQDTRTQAEIYRADRRKLAALVNRLRQDIAATDDYALRRSLQEELRQTLEQQKNLRAATAKSAQEALKELTQREQENREAKNSRTRRAMETAHKRYEAAVREAAKLTLAATKANNEEERRILMEKARREQEKANKYGAKEEKYSKNPADVRKRIDEDNKSFQAMREEASARGAAAAQKRKSTQAEKAASDAAIAAERQRAAAAGKPATTPQGQQPPAAQSAAAQQAAAAAQQAAAQAAQATAALAQLTAAIQGLSTTHGSLLTAVTQAAQTLETLATVTQSALADTARRLKTAEDKITRLLEKAR